MPPTRPRTDAELGFPKRSPVQWFSPPTLARSAAKVVLSAAFGEYLDKRELQQSLHDGLVASEKDVDEIWIDFVADSGDGFNPTYSVAWCVSQPTITPSNFNVALPRAQYLIFGGDQVYPYATPKEYDERFRGPFTAALPWTAADADRPHAPCPRVLAIPGNHDWYDGLTGFMRVFAQSGWLGGRERIQDRSYFALGLPGPYWLWGIDIGTDAYVDAPQIKYFKHAAEQMKSGDRLVLCTAKPSWVDLVDQPDAYRNLAFVERTLVPADVRTVLMLSGDQHHYARFEAANDAGNKRMKITAGGGGAFLAPTHKLDTCVDVPVVKGPGEAAIAAKDLETEPFDLKCRYPESSQSRRLTKRVMLLGALNPWFLTIPAVFYMLLYIVSVSAAHDDSLTMAEDPTHAVSIRDLSYLQIVTGGYSPATAVIFLIAWAVLGAFVILPKRLHRGLSGFYRATAGLVHALCHVGAQGAIAWVVAPLFGDIGDWRSLYLGAPTAAVLGAVIGSIIFAAFLGLVFTLFGWNATEAFSAFRYEGYKNFLRMHVTREAITLYPIGLDEICRSWDPDPDNEDAEASWLRPTNGTVTTRLIEGPLTLR